MVKHWMIHVPILTDDGLLLGLLDGSNDGLIVGTDVGSADRITLG